jgi:hypothetical protein
VKFQAASKESITQPEQDGAGKEDSAGKGGIVNKIGRIMGDTTTQPIGQKKAKQLLKEAATTWLSITNTSLAVDILH